LALLQKYNTEYALIVGMGATGISIAEHLSRKGKQFHFFDTRSPLESKNVLMEKYPDSRHFFEKIDEKVIMDAEEIYVSPGVPRDEHVIVNAIKHGKSVVGDVELFLREAEKPVVGITGSNGKSTVTTLVGMAAEKAGISVAVGGNIGKPALELLGEDVDLYVLELSSFQLESTTEPKLFVACNLNISVDHMDRYDSLSQYIMAKHRIFRKASHVVYNLDDPLTHPPIEAGVARYGFGLAKEIEKSERQFTFCPQSGWLETEGHHLISKEEIKLKGIHNVRNALALFAIADAVGIDSKACKLALEEFDGLPHRCEIIDVINNKTYINDSKATNVGATEAAIKGLAPEFDGIVLIAGGEGKDADFEEFTESVRDNVRALILIGKDAKKIARHIPKNIKVLLENSLEEAVISAEKISMQGEVILLSPACASFDMFSNFEERGEKFSLYVKNLRNTN